jgi:hypothetical protein
MAEGRKTTGKSRWLSRWLSRWPSAWRSYFTRWWRKTRQLPTLNRAGQAVVAGFAVLLLVVALAAPFYGSYILFTRSTAGDWAPYGLEIMQDDSGLRITSVDGQEARDAGIRPDDRVVRINGRRVPSPGYREWMLIPEGSRLPIEIASPDGTRRHALTRQAAAAEEVYSTAYRRLGVNQTVVRGVEFFLQAIPVAFLVWGAFRLLRRRKEAVAALILLAFLLISAGDLPVAPAAWADWGANPVGRALGYFGWLLLVLGLLPFPSGRFEPHWTVPAAFGASVWYMFALVYDPSEPVAYAGTILLLIACIAALGARYRRAQPGLERQQLRWVILGFARGTIVIAAAVILVQLQRDLTDWDKGFRVWTPMVLHLLIALGVASFTIGIIHGIGRPRKYVTDAVITRSSVYAGLVALFALVFSVMNWFIRIQLPTLGGPLGPWAEVGGAVVGLVVMTPAHRALKGWAERRFRKPLIDLRQGLPECLRELRDLADLEEVAAEILLRVRNSLGAERAALLVGDKAVAAREVTVAEIAEWRHRVALDDACGELSEDHNDPVFPLRLALRVRGGPEGRVLGWLLLGARPDGSIYGRDERQALQHTAGPIARALKAVLLRSGAPAMA